jgi:hypothetical protein
MEQEKCAGCGMVLSRPCDLQVRSPCPTCGSMARVIEVSITETLEAHDSVGFKHKREGHPKPIAEGISADDFFRKEEKWVTKERLIDREANRYHEKVTNPDTGEVIHICDEPLDEHIGHGAGKRSGPK